LDDSQIEVIQGNVEKIWEKLMKKAES
jgi:hypothetical protein